MPPTLIALVLASLTVLAGPTAQAPPLSCESAAFHQFDFWIGDWDVYRNGARVQRSTIERVPGGCSLDEHWTIEGGGSGRSLSAYALEEKRWHQFWVGSGPGGTYLSGGLEGRNMVLANTKNRVTYTPQADGNVRLVWQTSSDGGKTWEQVTDSVYKRRR